MAPLSVPDFGQKDDMGYYINQKCGSCKKSFTGGYVGNYSSIGEPFIICKKCGVVNDNSQRVTEWALKSRAGKWIFVAQHVFSVIFYYGAAALIAGMVLMGMDLMHAMTGLWILLGASLVFGLGRFWVRCRYAIAESDKRMADAAYVSRLRQLGFMR
ncbi:hypothetical protein [Kerstersia sp.]|uniref:hypothetical protein n=1 Tax=Kerstersia sp. TaxID=1930783 RepID=UPI003F8FF984